MTPATTAFPSTKTVDQALNSDNGLLNIGSLLSRQAQVRPNQIAVALAKADDRRSKGSFSWTYSELEQLSNRYANGLAKLGIARGMRTLLMVRPGIDFVALVFALFKLGGIPVMIDPGMGVRRLLECVRQVDLQAFAGVPLAHVLRVARPRSFAGVKHMVTVGRRWFWGGPTLAQLCKYSIHEFVPASTRRGETAAILFTSGSTGPAKGVVYTHGMFDAQVRMIQSRFGIEQGEIDLPTFPLFSLFSIGMGMTIVIPDMDPSHPARVNPVNIVSAIDKHKVTNTFGSPAVWRRVAAYCVHKGIKLPRLRRVLIAGAPVPWQTIAQLHEVLPTDVDVHTPYGATEALPVSSISGREVLSETAAATRRGAGTCVGRPFDGIEVRIIRIVDDPIMMWSDALELPHGKIGEIVVRGEPITREYFNLQEATWRSKIRDGDTIWHRMGDVGYLDDANGLWFCGRKAHRVETADGVLFTECAEPIFNEHPDVARCALIGLGERESKAPAIVVEPRPGRFPPRRGHSRFVEELRALGAQHEATRKIDRFFFRKSLPVDVRHNAKINREALTEWAREAQHVNQQPAP